MLSSLERTRDYGGEHTGSKHQPGLGKLIEENHRRSAVHGGAARGNASRYELNSAMLLFKTAYDFEAVDFLLSCQDPPEALARSEKLSSLFQIRLKFEISLDKRIEGR